MPNVLIQKREDICATYYYSMSRKKSAIWSLGNIATISFSLLNKYQEYNYYMINSKYFSSTCCHLKISCDILVPKQIKMMAHFFLPRLYVIYIQKDSWCLHQGPAYCPQGLPERLLRDFKTLIFLSHSTMGLKPAKKFNLFWITHPTLQLDAIQKRLWNYLLYPIYYNNIFLISEHCVIA